jgi:hypothetical protein
MSLVARAIAAVSVCLVLSCGGCRSADGDAGPVKKLSYTGPTLTMAEVVERVNQNNRAVPTLWARVYVEGNLVDERTKQSTFVNLDGAMLYRSPRHFRLTGDKLGSGFEVGSTDEHYWLKMTLPDANRMYFGETRHLGKPCVRQIPLQPDLLLEVLGVGPIDTNFLQPPAPVMRFNPDADAYMFVWVGPAGGPAPSAGTRSPGEEPAPAGPAAVGGGPARLVAQREIWYDRQTFLPRQVMLFDANGRVVLRALLDGHKPVVDGGPKVATLYRLLFPDSGSKLSIQVEELAFSKGQVPKTRGIVFPGADPGQAGVREVIKLDRDCKD